MKKTIILIFKILISLIAGLLVMLIVFAMLDDGTDNLGGGYYYTACSTRDIHGHSITIPPVIKNFSTNRQYIIVKQNLNGQNPARIYSECYDYNYPSVYGDYYWIIDKIGDKYYGPLRFDDFTFKCDSLHIDLVFDPQNESK